MSDNTTIARPYAKAIFQVACEQKQLAAWSIILQNLAYIILDSAVEEFILNPASSEALQSQLILTVIYSQQLKNMQSTPMNAMKAFVENLVQLLAQNKRLLLLPEISGQFELLRAEQEKTLTVQVASFAKLSHAQQQQLTDRLSQRLQRQVTLDLSIDTTLLGGAVIRAGDLVIDGSVRGKLNKLATALVA